MKSPEGGNFMSNVLRKIKRNKENTIFMSIKFQCPRCKKEKLVPQKVFQQMTNDTFKNTNLFTCDNCNIRMNPITVEVDY